MIPKRHRIDLLFGDEQQDFVPPFVECLGNGESGEEMPSCAAARDEELFGNRHEWKNLDSWNRSSCKHDMPFRDGSDRGADTVNVDEDSDHEEANRQIAAAVTDERKRHSLVRKQ